MSIVYVKPWFKSFPIRVRIASKVIWALLTTFGLEDLAEDEEDSPEPTRMESPLTAIEQIRVAKQALEIATILCTDTPPDDSRLEIIGETLMDSGPEIVFGFATVSQIQLEATRVLTGMSSESLFESVGAILAAMEVRLAQDPVESESFRLPTLMIGAADSNGNHLTEPPAPPDNRLLFQFAESYGHPSEG